MTRFFATAKARGLGGLLLVAALGAVGCSLEFKGVATEYRLSASTLAILGDDREAQQALDQELQRLFGTQQAPAFAAPADSLNRRVSADEFVTIGEARPGSQATAPSLAESAKLYEKKCLHCHGNEGGGDGVTAASLSPVPRDFRHGVYKYNNIADGGRPELIDFVRVITRGIEGTAMPSLRMHTEAEIHGLAEYTRLLAMRGETEAWLASDYEPGEPISAELADETYADIVSIWMDEERQRCTAPAEMPTVNESSIRRGFQLFHDAEGAACASCHGAGGLGKGPAAWGFAPHSPDEEIPLLRDQWGYEANPRNLVSDAFLHGEEPATLYERLYLGIDGTPMAGLGTIIGADGTAVFGTEEIWSLVHYVRALRDPQWEGLAEELARAEQAAQ